MIKRFRHKGLKALFEAGSARGLRPAHVKRLRLILARLDASQSLRDMDLPGLRLHPLKGRLKGHFAVTISGSWRVTFRFDGPDAVNVNYLDYH
ncbi:MAG: type II toxin-antitoxin system RelE/ParE family toxin [Rhodospirillales bacterium]